MKNVLINFCSIFVVANAFRSGIFDSFRRETEAKKNVSKLYSVEEFLGLECSQPVCEGDLADIYCRGDILATAWYFNLQDVCPGTRLRYSPETVHSNFAKLPRPITFEDFENFCLINFEFVPYLESAKIIDWHPVPEMFNRISDKRIVFLANFINDQWLLLSRKFTKDVLLNRTFYPVLPVPNPFFVPGGRFQVYFYWDSYWILKGLLATDMIESAKNILENFAYIIDSHGFIPNSGHIQLSRRSQPPLYTQMVADYFAKTKDIQFLRSVLPLLKKEMKFWETNRTISIEVDDKKYLFYQYRVSSNCPRPESFLIDFLVAKDQTLLPNEIIWSSLASACESGLDFTSRWFGTPKNRKGIRTNLIVPVDLNVFIVQNYKLISKWSHFIEDYKEAERYKIKADKLSNSINSILFDSEKGTWYDYDIQTRKLRKEFYPSNIFPLLINPDNKHLCDKVLNYLNNINIFDFQGGIPSSFDNQSKEQWDYPNSWAPSVHLFVESLLSCPKSHKSQIYAKSTAKKFVMNVFNGVLNFGKIWEKYDARFDDGRSGEGGEYLPQYGFGWTNGATLEFITMFFVDDLDDVQNSFMLNLSNNNIDSKPTFSKAAIFYGFCFLIGSFTICLVLFKLRKTVNEENTYLFTKTKK